MATDDSKPEDEGETDGSTADASAAADASTADDSAADNSVADDPATDDDSKPGYFVPNDTTPDDLDEPEAELLPDDPAADLGPDVPRAPDTSNEDVDPELKKQFWKLVLIFNVALFGMSLGLMLVGFEGRWTLGGAIFLVGAVAFARGWLGYQDATSDIESADD